MQDHSMISCAGNQAAGGLLPAWRRNVDRDESGSQSYTGDWAFSRTDEKAAFERFMVFVSVRLEKYPDLHVYHFAPYEPAALKPADGLVRHARERNRPHV